MEALEVGLEDLGLEFFVFEGVQGLARLAATE